MLQYDRRFLELAARGSQPDDAEVAGGAGEELRVVGAPALRGAGGAPAASTAPPAVVVQVPTGDGFTSRGNAESGDGTTATATAAAAAAAASTAAAVEDPDRVDVSQGMPSARTLMPLPVPAPQPAAAAPPTETEHPRDVDQVHLAVGCAERWTWCNGGGGCVLLAFS